MIIEDLIVHDKAGNQRVSYSAGAIIASLGAGAAITAETARAVAAETNLQANIDALGQPTVGATNGAGIVWDGTQNSGNGAWVNRDRVLDVVSVNGDIVAPTAGSNKMNAALVPTFCPVSARTGSFALTGFIMRVRTLFAASTVGIALYTITYSAASTFSCTLVANLNSAISSATTGIKKGDIATPPYAMDLTAHSYVVGVMVSDVATLAVSSQTGIIPNLGAFQFSGSSSGVARSSTTDWPGTFDQTYVSAMGGGTTDVLAWVGLSTAAGKYLM